MRLLRASGWIRTAVVPPTLMARLHLDFRNLGRGRWCEALFAPMCEGAAAGAFADGMQVPTHATLVLHTLLRFASISHKFGAGGTH